MVQHVLKHLSQKKAPGTDHILQGMLQPLQKLFALLLLYLLKLCWWLSYTSFDWRVAEVVPIHKKGASSDPGNYRFISLASVFRKLLGRCLYPLKPTSKFGQGGFREAPSFPDQTLCLAMICNMLCRYHRTTLILAFLDINSAYDTVNRRKIWEVMQATAEPPLLALLQNLFDGVHIEILFQNATSRRFQPITGMLQGSILLPPPNTIYINQLPHILSAQPFQEDLSLIQLAPLMNCLLYVDDGVLIADQYKMVELLQKCEEHNTALSYR